MLLYVHISFLPQWGITVFTAAKSRTVKNKKYCALCIDRWSWHIGIYVTELNSSTTVQTTYLLYWMSVRDKGGSVLLKLWCSKKHLSRKQLIILVILQHNIVCMKKKDWKTCDVSASLPLQVALGALVSRTIIRDKNPWNTAMTSVLKALLEEAPDHDSLNALCLCGGHCPLQSGTWS